jgi:hypothetical protein
MAVFTSEARLLDAAGQVIGEGRAYIHLRQDASRPQAVQGTMSLRRWEPDAPAPAAIALADGRRLPIRVEADALSACLGTSRILRYKAQWPPMAG